MKKLEILESNKNMEQKSVHSAFFPRSGTENDAIKKIQNIPLEQIDVSDSYVKSEADFKKVSHDEMVRGTQTLESEVRPAVEKGADGDYFYHLDQQRGVDAAQGTEQIYHAFYGDDSIHLEKIGDKYKVINGYHRLYVAKELGLKTIPASIEKKL